MVHAAEVVLVALCVLGGAVGALNDRPIIGVLSQELDTDMWENYSDNYTSYIAASYVKFLESSGSRVVPIWINQSTQYYEDIVDSVNGLLLPGGAAEFNATDGYATAGWKLYKLAKRKNDDGIHFPVWGTCLGFELLAFLSANKTEVRNVCGVQRVAMPLTLKPDHLSSKLYKGTSDDVIGQLKNHSVMFHNHNWCVTEQSLVDSDAAEQWHILSASEHNGTEFISSFEHKKYPFYGVQFHPEKNAFEWKIESIPHSALSISAAQFYGNFLVNEARKNNNSFSNMKQEGAALIYNYPVTYTGGESPFEQSYFFEAMVWTPTTTTTTTTTTTAATTETTSTTTASAKAVTQPSAQAKDKHSSAPAHNRVSYALLCVTAMLSWGIPH